MESRTELLQGREEASKGRCPETQEENLKKGGVDEGSYHRAAESED